jgi:leader peptidase (prepilin peptidase)/N-methyltransferase
MDIFVTAGTWPAWTIVVDCGVVGFLMGWVGRLVLLRSTVRLRCRPPWCELASAFLSALLGWRAAVGLLPWWWLPVPLLLGWFAVPLAAADLARRRLPDVLTLSACPALGLAVALAAVVGPDGGLWVRALGGVVVFGGVHLLVRALAPTAIGGGDVKLAGSLGVVLGALGWAALALAAVGAACCTLVLAVASRSRTAAHGPGLLAAAWLLAAFPATAFPAPGLPAIG